MNQEHARPASAALPSLRYWIAALACLLIWAGCAIALRRESAPLWFGPAGLLLIEQAALAIFAALAAAAALTKASLRMRSRIALAAEGLMLAAFIAMIVAIDRKPLWDGIRTSGDNLLHFTLASLTEANLFSQGALRGWCSALGMGFPLNDLYPPGGNILVIGFRALTLWLVSMERVYAWTVCGAYLGFALLLYRAVRLHGGAAAGAVLLAFLLLDNDDWYFTLPSSLDGGLWAIQLGLGLSINAFALWLAPGFPRSRRHSLEFLACIAFSILLHPFYVFLNGLWLLCIALATWLGRGWRGPFRLGSPWLRLALFGLGYAIAAFWWVPFALSRDWIFAYGYWGRFMPEPGRLMIEAALFKEAPPYISLFALAAAVWGLFSRRPFAFCATLFVWINLFIGVEPARYVFSLHGYQGFFDHMQTERLFAAAKIVSLLLLGLIGADIRSAIAASPQWQRAWAKLSEWIWPGAESQTWPQRIAGAVRDQARLAGMFAIGIPLCLFAGNLVHAIGYWELRPALQRVYSTPGDGFWPAFIDARERFADELGEEASIDEFLSTPFPERRALTPIAWRLPSLAAQLPIGLFVTGYLPANVIGTRPLYSDEWTLDLAQANLVIEPKDEATYAQFDNRSLWFENDNLTVSNRTPGLDHPWTLSGAGQVEQLPDENGAIRFEFSGTDQTSFFRIGISRYRKWIGTLNGESVDLLLPAQAGEPEEAWKFIGFAAQDGVFELRYENEWFDWYALWLSLAALAAAVLVFVPPVYRRLHSLPGLSLKAERYVHGAASALILLAALAPAAAIYAPTETAYEPEFRFMGNYVDHVGTLGDRADGVTDMIFLLEFEKQDGAIAAIDLIHLDESGAEAGDFRFSTRHPHQNTLGAIDMLGQRADFNDGSLELPASRFQRLLLFAPNPYDGPIPMPLRMKCVIEYAGGGTQEFMLR